MRIINITFWSNLVPHSLQSSLSHNTLTLALPTSCTVFLKPTEYWIPLTILENSMYTIGWKSHHLLYPIMNLQGFLNSVFLIILEWSDLYPDQHMYPYFKTYLEQKSRQWSPLGVYRDNLRLVWCFYLRRREGKRNMHNSTNNVLSG